MTFILISLWCDEFSDFLSCFFGMATLSRQCIQEIQVLMPHFRSGPTPKLLLGLELLAIMMKSNFPFLPCGHQRTTFCLLFFMLICKQNLKLRSQLVPSNFVFYSCSLFMAGFLGLIWSFCLIDYPLPLQCFPGSDWICSTSFIVTCSVCSLDLMFISLIKL